MKSIFEDLQSFGAIMLGAGGGGDVGGGGVAIVAANVGDTVPNGAGSEDLRDASSVVISKRDNSAPFGRGETGDDAADSADNELVRADANKLVTAGGRRHRPPPPPAVTGTPKPPTTELDDLLISVKTTKSYHDTRLEMIIKTWYQLAKEQNLPQGQTYPQDIHVCMRLVQHRSIGFTISAGTSQLEISDSPSEA
uniref:Fringe-like glycosyltransferase domain-containing protein n=1 Tax=Anopheles farauti TaxID=69004 RepID=A0A182Q7H9_9DIPT